MKLLLAEDEKSLSRALCAILRKNNHTVDAVFDGAEALDYLDTGGYDAVILDIMMPVTDGITVLKTMRARGDHTPVIMLTAKTEIDDRVLGLDSGANDYLTKPFDSRELLARLRAITRKEAETDAEIMYGNLRLNRKSFVLSCGEETCHLANKEYQMMELLMKNPDALVSTERMMEKIWGYDSDAEINVVWVCLSGLRKKLAGLGANVQIKASRNSGYMLEKTDEV